MTYVHGQAELLLLNLRLKLAHPVTESTGSLQRARLAACPYGVERLFFTGCLHPRKRRKDGARLLIPYISDPQLFLAPGTGFVEDNFSMDWGQLTRC